MGGRARSTSFGQPAGDPRSRWNSHPQVRLYDIDVVINRTLVYGSLTVMLALVYIGGVAATEAIFRALTGQERQPQIAVVVTTLVIAALFSPLRRRIQGFIDRISERTKRQRRLVGIPTFLLLTGVLVLSSVRLAQIGSYSVYFSVFFGPLWCCWCLMRWTC